MAGASERKRSARPERKTGRQGERDAGGQPAMRMLRLCAAECVCVCLCVRAQGRECVCVRGDRKRERHSALPARCVAI